MYTLHRLPYQSKTRKYRQTPVNTGVLIDLYLHHQSLVVIDNYLSSYSITEEDKDRYQERRIEFFNNRLVAGKIFQNLKLPRWRSLPEDLRQVFKIAAVGILDNAVAVSCNIGPRAVRNAAHAPRGAANYVGRKIRGLPGISPEMAAVLEDAAHRQGCNPGLHFHAAFRAPADQIHFLEASLLSLFASDYVEVADNKAILIKPITHPGRWASYCCKTLRRPDQVNGQASFASNPASRAGEQLYNQVMHWLRQLPTLDKLQADLDSLVRPHIQSKPCPELLRMIIQQAERRKEAQLRRGQQTRHFKWLATNNPDQFRYELVEMLRIASAVAVDIPDITLTELAEEAIFENCSKGAPEHSSVLTERYTGLPGVGEWATTNEDDEPLFGHHPDPDS